MTARIRRTFSDTVMGLSRDLAAKRRVVCCKGWFGGVPSRASNDTCPALAFGLIASVSVRCCETPAVDDDQERRVRLLFLGKGAVLAHRLPRPLAAESDD